MSTPFDSFEKKKDYLICVDSDGCAMDTMDIKHFKCFGPCMVDEWELGEWREPILKRWNDINLYTMTRGINRFKGLAIALAEINEQYKPIEHVEALVEWAEHAPELSNPAVKKMWEETKDPVFEKALSWSLAVNRSITELRQDEKLPFPGVAEGLAAAQQYADVAIVSSANRDAVEEEWEYYKLLTNVDILLCQDAGSKAHCIAELMKKGYAPDHVLMVGDAPGDRDAAKKNGVFYYPILVRQEAESWEQAPSIFETLASGTYGEIAADLERRFEENLKGE